MRTIVGLMALLLLSSVAFADNIQEAKAHYKKGTAAYALGHYDDAAKEYETAFAAEPDPALLYNAAQAHRLAGNNVRALQLYKSYLRLYGGQVKNQDEIERHIADLQKAIDSQQAATQAPPQSTSPPAEHAPEPATTATTVTTSAPAAAVTATSVPAERPVYKKPWFWATMAAVVVVVGVGVGVGVGLGAGGKRNPNPSYGMVTF